MLCTYCNTEFEVPDVVKGNLSAYGGVSRIATPCCQQPFKINIAYSFKGEPFKPNSSTDDWGVPYKKDSLIGKYCLIKYDCNLTHGVVCEIIDETENDIIVKQFGNSLFRKSSILLIGSKEEIETASIDHRKIEETIKEQKNHANNMLNSWLKDFKHLKYSSE